MQLPIFELENYLSTREFRAPYMLGGSDAQCHTMAEILAMADAQANDLWKNLPLSYTEPYGLPHLLAEIAKDYGTQNADDNVLTFAGAEEGIYCACHALLEKGDHVISVTPGYQSSYSIPGSICSISEVLLRHEDGWKLDISQVENAVQKNTKMILFNFPHNPTGAMISKDEMNKLVDIARAHGLWIFSDEVYRGLELDENDQLPTIASIYEKGLSLGVMSKALGLPGLRVGWIVGQDKQALLKMSDMKHYLSICNSAPSEILSLIALRAKDKIIQRNMKIVNHNIALLDDFLNEFSDLFEWVRPKGGCIGFPKFKGNISAFDFSENLLNEKGVVTLPSSVYGYEGEHIRLGFGRQNMPEALGHMRDFVKKNHNVWLSNN